MQKPDCFETEVQILFIEPNKMQKPPDLSGGSFLFSSEAGAKHFVKIRNPAERGFAF
jgi:hypothetical protein